MEPVPSTSSQGCKHHNKATGSSMDAKEILAKLDDLESAIREGDLNSVKNFIDILLDESNKNLLVVLCKDGEQCISHNLIIAACEQNNDYILFYLLHETDILECLTNKTFKEQQEDELRKKAFISAMCSGNVRIVEMLYEHWRGDMHWTASNNNDGIIQLLSRLGKLLKETYDACQEHMATNSNMIVNAQCLIMFNDFQYTIYTNLRKVMPQIINSADDKTVITSTAKEVITQVLCAYKEFSEMKYANAINVNLSKETKDARDAVMQKTDNDTLYKEWWIYLLYEKYYIKLDFYVSLLILDNLNILKRSNEIKIPADMYDEIECAIYHFIFRAFDDWKLYLPKNRNIKKIVRPGLHNGKKIDVEMEYDSDKVNAISVLYLERRKFKKCLDNFNIHTHNINNKDLNYLKKLPYMRDYYSLKKIVYYLEVVEKDIKNQEINVLIIERALLVVGEMTKSSDESYHLAPTTEALLITEISLEIIKCIRWIRKFISHIKKGQQSVRIDIAENNEQTFRKIQTDTTKITEAVKSVIEIHEPILYKSFLQHGLDLISERIKEWPAEVSKHKDDVYNLLKERDQASFDSYKEKVWTKSGLTKELFEEIISTLSYKESLSLMVQTYEELITKLGVSRLQKYIPTIKYTLQHIKENNQNWEFVKPKLEQKYKKKYVNYPTLNEINNIINKLDKNTDKYLLEKVIEIKDVSDHWKSIKNVLTFFLHEIRLWEKDAAKEELLNAIQIDDCLSDKAIDAMNTVITLMEKDLSGLGAQNASIGTGIVTTSLQNVPQHTYAGIDELYKMTKNKKGNVEHRSILKNRVAKLRNVLGYPNAPSLSQHRRRYMRDPKFRSELEMLLTDICNIFVECKKRNLMNKSSKLLAGVDLRNVLEHGNPMLEVIGDVLDPLDFSTELLTKARRVAQDPDSIEADLFSQNKICSQSGITKKQ